MEDIYQVIQNLGAILQNIQNKANIVEARIIHLEQQVAKLTAENETLTKFKEDIINAHLNLLEKDIEKS